MGCFNVHGFYSHLPIEGGIRYLGAVLVADSIYTVTTKGKK